MSGGSLDYVYCRVDDAAASIGGTPEQDAFAAHLRKVAKALHDIEWVYSCDMSHPAEVPAIMECITPAHVLAVTVEQAQQAAARLEAAMKAVERWEL